MAKRRIEEELEQLSSLRSQEAQETAEWKLSKALGDKVNLIVAKAASVAAELQLASLIPEMLTAYDRLFKDGAKSDPQCWGKSALAKALKTLGYEQAAPFLRGSRYRQTEPVWGGEVDTAATLRGTCALALVQCTDIPVRQILSAYVDALGDAAIPVRQDAVQALGQLGSVEAALLLRLKARLGDEDPAVTGNVFDILLGMEETDAVEFVSSFLDDPKEEVMQEAALALGSSKLEGAAAVLIQRWNQRLPTEPFELWIRALGASRLPSAFACLVEILRSGRGAEVAAAIVALQSRRLSAETWDGIAVVLAERGDAALQSTFKAECPRPE